MNMRTSTIIKLTAGAFILGCITGCTTIDTNDDSANIPQVDTNIKSAKTVKVKWKAIPDISGMAPINKDKYLVVHDTKWKGDLVKYNKKPLIGTIKIKREDEKLKYKALSFTTPPSPLSNDLESICRLSGRKKEFLISESTYRGSKFGRIFHVKLEKETDKVTILHELNLPNDAVQYESMACRKTDAGYQIILAQRSGTDAYLYGAFRWGNFDPQSTEYSTDISWSRYVKTKTSPLTTEIEKTDPIKAPSLWGEGHEKFRAITGMSIDHENTLYASAAIDCDKDLGPFRSMIYTLGKINDSVTDPITLASENTRGFWIMDGVKVEAVTTGKNKKSLSYGSEDEKLGGIWRELPSTPSLIGATTPIPYTCPKD